MKKKLGGQQWKKHLCTLLTLMILLALTACGTQESVTTESEKSITSESVSTDTEWAVYWYLCGSDLESNYSAATNDLAELMDVEMPETVKVVIQTGGASVWQNDVVNVDTLGRYVYDHNGLQLIEELPSASMGDAQTLEDFLAFGKENYPAKRTAVVFWNHGGGSVSGAAFDELYGMDSLSLAEMYQAFLNAFGENPQEQLVDIIGFDTCLMATVDTAYTFSDIGKYLVASQEVEPGNGWLYSGWLGALGQTPDMEPMELAKVICDSYAQGCEEVGTEDNITLSVTDLSKVSDLVAAYDDFGKEALAKAIEDPVIYHDVCHVGQSRQCCLLRCCNL
jgi:hypothetical protein